MHKKLLNKYFKENKVTDKMPSAQALAQFMMRMAAKPDVENELMGFMDNTIKESSPERIEEAASGKEEIANATTPAEIITLMRRGVDIINRRVLVAKAMTMEAEVVPEVVRRLKTNLSTMFIEVALQFLARSTINVSEDLIGYFDEMRNPYAQSIVLVLLGFKADEKHIPWLIDRHHMLKKLYPRENYYQGAYYALLEMEGRFYL